MTPSSNAMGSALAGGGAGEVSGVADEHHGAGMPVGQGVGQVVDAGDHDAVLGGGDRAAGDFAGAGGKGLDEPIQPDRGSVSRDWALVSGSPERPAPQYVSPSGEVM
jgi:hypothetical protein